MVDVWHYRKLYSSLTLNTIPQHLGPFKTSRFVGLFVIINKYTATMKDAMHLSHPILKTLVLLIERWGRCLFNVWILYFWMWITEFSAANLRLILRSKSGWGVLRRLLQLKWLRTHPDFLPSCQCWNLPGSPIIHQQRRRRRRRMKHHHPWPLQRLPQKKLGHRRFGLDILLTRLRRPRRKHRQIIINRLLHRHHCRGRYPPSFTLLWESLQHLWPRS